MSFHLKYKPFGTSAILIEWPAKIDLQIIQDITSFEKLVAQQQLVVETIIAYHSLMICYDDRSVLTSEKKPLVNFEREIQKLKKLYTKNRKNYALTKRRVWQIPVCYDLKFGIDLKEIAKSKKISTTTLVDLHSDARYYIYFIGFQPGFLYLGGLDSRIHMPRRSNPRLHVEKGSVAIGGAQTGIYPQDSPGGWNIIGKSPVDFFDIVKSKPCFAKAGEFVRFVPVELEIFFEISQEIKQGKYQVKFDWQ